MKMLLTVVSLCFASLAAAKPMAFLKQSGGFCPGTCPTSSITVEENGTVFVEIEKFQPTHTVERRVLLTLGKDLVSAMQKDIQTISASELIDTDQDQPICADIPQHLYTIVKKGQKIDIGIDRDCHKFRLTDFQGNRIVDMLKSFLDLYYYSQN